MIEIVMAPDALDQSVACNDQNRVRPGAPLVDIDPWEEEDRVSGDTGRHLQCIHVWKMPVGVASVSPEQAS